MADACVFCLLATGAIPVEPVFEDGEFLAFHDQNPQAPVHVIVIPKEHFRSVLEAEDPALLGRGLDAVKRTARSLGLASDGFRIVVNTGDDGGQTVPHLHFHLLGGRFMQWPPG